MHCIILHLQTELRHVRCTLYGSAFVSRDVTIIFLELSSLEAAVFPPGIIIITAFITVIIIVVIKIIVFIFTASIMKDNLKLSFHFQPS